MVGAGGNIIFEFGLGAAWSHGNFGAVFKVKLQDIGRRDAKPRLGVTLRKISNLTHADAIPFHEGLGTHFVHEGLNAFHAFFAIQINAD